ncbi:protein of unknown function [Burkholderia multivorans]
MATHGRRAGGFACAFFSSGTRNAGSTGPPRRPITPDQGKH